MEFVNNSWVLIVLLGIIFSLKFLFPKLSYELKSSLIIGSIGAIYFAVRFISLVDDDFSLWPFIFCAVCCYFIYCGGKTVAYKTLTGVFSDITKKPVGIMEAGSLNWADPIFETVTISVDGVPNKSADLQELKIKISETPLMQTKTRGIQAKIKNITFMLKLSGNISELFRIEGGAKTIRERIVDFTEEFFLGRISQILPETLDQDKKEKIEELAKDLKKEVNKFCLKNKYPYQITDTVIITDTELEVKYYEVLAKKEFVKLEQEAKDVEAIKLRERIVAFGEHVLPGAPAKEQLDTALISLGIVKRDIQEKKYSLDTDLVQLAKDIASYFKK